MKKINNAVFLHALIPELSAIKGGRKKAEPSFECSPGAVVFHHHSLESWPVKFPSRQDWQELRKFSVEMIK